VIKKVLVLKNFHVKERVNKCICLPILSQLGAAPSAIARPDEWKFETIARFLCLFPRSTVDRQRPRLVGDSLRYFLVADFAKSAPIWSPLIQAISHRR
jgi:hypothetical protein